MNNPEGPSGPSAPPKWNIGQLLDENRATRCAHRRIEFFYNAGQREVEAKVKVPGNPDMKLIERVLVGVMSPAAVCYSPTMVQTARALMPPDLAPQVTRVLAPLEICRLCPFWEAMQ